MKYWQITATSCLILALAACGGGSSGGGDSGERDGSPAVIVEEISFTGISLSMSESIAIGTLAEQQLQIANGPVDISNLSLALTGTGSEYFSVSIAEGESAGKYLGNLSLVKSLFGLGGSELNFTAIVTVGEQSLSASVKVKLTELETSLANLNHGNVFNKNRSRLGTGESDSRLVIATQPAHGDVEAYYVGNEHWDFHYTSTDCFEGQDSYLYKVGNEYGRVSINLESVLEDMTINAEVGTTTLENLAPVLPMYFSPTIAVTQPENGLSNYDADTSILSYTPSSSATSDRFTYAANGCAKNVTVNITHPPQLLGLTSAETGHELWKTDGTVAGTVLVKDINLGTESSSPSSFIRRPSDGMYLFKASIGGELQIWKTDGTEGNTELVKVIPVEHYQSIYSVRDLLLVGDDAYFTTKTSSTFKLWKSNGTESGTAIVKELPVGSSGTGYLNTVNGKVLFSYDTPAAGNDTDPWVSDGTEGGTVELKDIWPGSGGSSFMKGSMIEFKGKLYSKAEDGTHGAEIWMTDGTSEGTEMLKDLELGNNAHSIPTHFTVADDVFYFAAVTSDKGDQLWKSDGTPENTVPVKDMNPNSAERDQDLFGGDFFYGQIKQGANINGLLFFAAKNEDNGIELWKSDGTESGTAMVKDLMLGTNFSSRPDNFVELDNTLYFLAWALDNSRVLWKSDGTENGTVVVKSFSPNTYNPDSITLKSNGRFMLLDVNRQNSSEVWRSDGTEAGTYLLKENGSLWN